MISKILLKQILTDNRREIEKYTIIPRNIDTSVFNCLAFVGVRRAGKSFILFQKMQEMLHEGHTWDEMLYINFEDERLEYFDSSDFNTILEAHIEMGGVDKPMLFFDEIHNILGWEKFASRMADAKYPIWITGSDANMLSNEVISTLSGRFLPIEVFPFDFVEYLNAKEIPANEQSLLSTTGKASIVREFSEYLSWGGLPESIPLPAKRNYLSSVFQKIYLGDICTRNNISNPRILRLLVKKIAESIRKPISYSRLTKAISSAGGRITIPTTSSYIHSCEEAWLILRTHNISASLAMRETNCKYYFVDNGLLSLMLIDPTPALLENQVAISLFRSYGCDENNERVFFYSENVDIDFYIPEEQLAIQVSYSLADEHTHEKVEALAKFPKAQPCARRILITYDEEDIITDRHGIIDVIPCWKWMLNLSKKK